MKEYDILARQSRPQQHSTWVPKTRDWRYATGVFQHDDFENDPKDRSAWDTMDYDYQVSSNAKNSRGSLNAGGTGGGSHGGDLPIDSSDRGGSAVAKSPKPMIQKNVWASIAKYRSINSAANGNTKSSYEAISVLVRLRFTGTNIAKMHRILNYIPDYPPTSQSITNPDASHTLKAVHSLGTSARARTTTTVHAPQTLNIIEPNTSALFERSWLDETRDFNMNAVRKTLQKPGANVEDLEDESNWYTNAVPVNAIFPPGVPLSAKEINAYYPHHVQWKGVMLRLTNNDFRGADILGMQVSCYVPTPIRDGVD